MRTAIKAKLGSYEDRLYVKIKCYYKLLNLITLP